MSDAKPCPSCGHCPTCGRGPVQVAPRPIWVVPQWPYTQPTPWWETWPYTGSPWTLTVTTNTASNTSTLADALTNAASSNTARVRYE